MPATRLTRRQAIMGAAASLAALSVEAAAAQVAQPRRGGVPRVALPRIPDRIDLATHEGWEGAWVQSLIYDSALRATMPGDIVASAGIAYLTDPDGRFAEIPVRHGLAFSSGEVVTARDLASSIERSIANTPPGDAWRWTAVERVEVVGEDRVRIHVGALDATLPATLASPLVPVMPAGALDEPFLFDSLPAGTGPFIPRRDDGGVLQFRPNRLHWVVGQPWFDGCNVIAVEQEIERTARLVTGQVDIVPNVPSLDIPLLDEDPQLGLVGLISRRQCAVMVRVDEGPLRDVEVRRLVASIIDRETLVEGATAGAAAPSSTLFPPDLWAGLPEHEIEPVADVEDVRDQLAALGLLPGWPIRLVCPDDSPALANSAVLLQERFANAGIAVSIDLLAGDAMDATRISGDFDLMMTFLPLWNDPHELAHPWLHSTGSRNAGGFSSRRVDQLLALARLANDEVQRGALYREIQRIVFDQLPLIPLFAMPWFDGVRTRIEGYTASMPPSARSAANAWFAPP